MTRMIVNRASLALAAVAALATSAAAADGTSHTFVVNVDEGKISVTVDGKDLPTSRIRIDDGRLVLLDEQGNEVRSFDVPLSQGDEQMHLQWTGEQPFFDVQNIRLEHAPKVMVGVHLDDPPEPVLYHLRLKPGQTTMISDLFKDLPAYKAGLGRFDIIVAVDGAQPADPKSILDALADKEPGDEVTFTVIHEGRTKEYTVTLEAFDRARMNPQDLIGGNGITNEITIPGEWGKILIDPESGQGFWQLREFKLPEGFGQDLRRELGERARPDLDQRIEALNERIEQLQDMISQLVEQAKELSDEANQD